MKGQRRQRRCFPTLTHRPRAPHEPISAARNGRASRRNGSDARTFRHTLNRGEKRQSHGVTADAHSYPCPKSTRGRYRHDSHRPCVVLAFRRMCWMLKGTSRKQDREPTGCFFPSFYVRADCPRSPPKCFFYLVCIVSRWCEKFCL